MSYLDKIFKQTFYGISRNLKYQLFENLVSAVASKPAYIVEIIEGSWIGTPWNNKEQKYSNYGQDYVIYTCEGEKTAYLMEGEWKAKIDHILSGNYFQRKYPRFLIISSNGVSRNDSTIDELKQEREGLDQFVQVIQFLRKLEDFQNWSHYDLYTENEKLKAENSRLMQEIEKLKKE